MRDTYTNSIIKVHYIWYYNMYKLCILCKRKDNYFKVFLDRTAEQHLQESTMQLIYAVCSVKRAEVAAYAMNMCTMDNI